MCRVGTMALHEPTWSVYAENGFNMDQILGYPFPDPLQLG